MWLQIQHSPLVHPRREKTLVSGREGLNTSRVVEAGVAVKTAAQTAKNIELCK